MAYKIFTLKINNDYYESVTFANRNLRILFSASKIELHENSTLLVQLGSKIQIFLLTLLRDRSN